MAESMEELERRIDGLRSEVRRAAATGDRVRARALRAELRRAEHAWEDALAELEERALEERALAGEAAPVTGEPAAEGPVGGRPAAGKSAGPLLPLREQVHQALTLLTVPAAPKLIVTVHEALFAGEILGARLTSLRRDEERSFVSAPFSRPYYICGALTADLLAAVRGLLAVSTWPMDRRVIGPLSPRVDFLTAAIRVAGQVARMGQASPAANRLLWRFAGNIPGAADGFDAMQPEAVARAAQAELEIHQDADRSHREAAARRARSQLSDVEQLFGGRLRAVPDTAVGA